MSDSIHEKIEAAHYNIQDLFSDKFLFEIPIFQRPFSWEEDNFQQLFDDINDSLENNIRENGNKISQYDPYFLGTIILWVKESKNEQSIRYHIIDGQQRLISLAILMATIRDITNESDIRNTMRNYIYQKASKTRGTPESIRITIREKEKDFFEKFILSEKGTDDIEIMKKEAKHIAESNIIDAVKIFKSCFFNKKTHKFNKNLIDHFSSYLSQKVVIVIVKSWNLSSAFRLFNVINTRGMKLNNSDLLKSKNFSKINESKQENCRRIWEDIEEYMDTNGGMDLLIRFIRNIKIKEKARKNVFEEYENIIFKKEPNFIGENFIKYLEDVFSIYQEKIIDAKLNTSDSISNVRYFNLISLMRVFLPYNDWMTIIISYCMKFSEDSLYDFLIKLEKKLVVDWVCGLSFTQRLTQIFKIITLIENNTNVSSILSDPILNDEILKNEKIFLERIDDFNLYRKDHGRIPKYLLLRLDLSERDQENVNISYTGKITLEHILPQKPSDNYWLKRFSESDRLNWTNRVGNLILLNSNKNSKVGRKPFPDKVKDYISKRKGDFAITNDICKISDWDMKTLKKRHTILKERFKEIWIESD